MANKAFRFADRDVRQTSVWHVGRSFSGFFRSLQWGFQCLKKQNSWPNNQPTNQPILRPNRPNQPTNQSSPFSAKPLRQGIPKGGVKKIILTGSGGTFRDMPLGTNVFHSILHPNLKGRVQPPSESFAFPKSLFSDDNMAFRGRVVHSRASRTCHQNLKDCFTFGRHISLEVSVSLGKSNLGMNTTEFFVYYSRGRFQDSTSDESFNKPHQKRQLHEDQQNAHHPSRVDRQWGPWKIWRKKIPKCWASHVVTGGGKWEFCGIGYRTSCRAKTWFITVFVCCAPMCLYRFHWCQLETRNKSRQLVLADRNVSTVLLLDATEGACSASSETSRCICKDIPA